MRPRGVTGAPARVKASTHATPSATAALLHDCPDGIEALMVRRHAGLRFAAGAWVFPGGVIEDRDTTSGDTRSTGDDLLAAAPRAAARETLEETGLAVDP